MYPTCDKFFIFTAFSIQNAMTVGWCHRALSFAICTGPSGLFWRLTELRSKNVYSQKSIDASASFLVAHFFDLCKISSFFCSIQFNQLQPPPGCCLLQGKHGLISLTICEILQPQRVLELIPFISREIDKLPSQGQRWKHCAP